MSINSAPLLRHQLSCQAIKFATTFDTVKSIRASIVLAEPISEGFDNGVFAEEKKEDTSINSFRLIRSRMLLQIIEKY